MGTGVFPDQSKVKTVCLQYFKREFNIVTTNGLLIVMLVKTPKVLNLLPTDFALLLSN